MDFSGIISSLFSVIAQTDSGGALNWLTEKFIAGGMFMWPILGCLILGLAFCFERVWTLTRSKTDTKQFIIKVRRALDESGIEGAKELCATAEKAIIAYGGIEMGFLERGMIWISLFISLAPMLGFTGTVQGMIDAFDAIKEAAQISPAIVADGIAIALLTTLFGLVVAMLLQVFYNFIVSRIDSLVGDMEEASIELIDALYEVKTKK
jgi:biopolymer transport protein ExbB